MSQTNDTPIFNLKAVVQETGLKPDTLRAWERRYGLPKPQRTPSGHRLYTQRDIDTLKWLIARQDEGLNISRAVALWHEVTREQGDPLRAQPLDQPTVRPAVAAPSLHEQPSSHGQNRLTTLREQWVNACLNFDEQAAESTLSTAFALFPVEIVCMELVQRGLAAIGRGWYEDKVTVQQEHFASALAIRRLEALLASTPPPTRPERIMVGCPPEESHTFVPLMLSLMLRRRGWNVLYLGADVPLRSLEATVMSTRPALVILTAQQLHTAASLLDMAQILFAQRVPLAFGGLIFNQIEELPQVIPGIFLGPRLDAAVRNVEQLMPVLRPQAAAREVSRRFLAAAHTFTERRALIEAEVWKGMEYSGMPQRHLAGGNASLGRNIIAALSLGSMDYLGPDMAWIEGLLVNHYQMPVHLLRDYLRVYYGAARHHLDADGAPIVEWLAQLLGVAAPEQTRTPRTSVPAVQVSQ